MAPIRAALLDVDGTLLDSNDAHARAFADAFAEHGLQVPFDTIRRCIGMGGDLLIPEVSGLDAELGVGKAVAERKKELFFEMLPSLRPTPGARELVRRMKDDGLALVVATSAAEEELEGLLRQAGVLDLLPRRTSADDADVSKPAPDILEAALKKAGVAPSEALMLGDTPYDRLAAERAGVGFVAVRCGGWDFPEGAVYDDPADLLAHWDASPFRQA
jgi:HAD superfamily hydrolase (TIGR01509 family)